MTPPSGTVMHDIKQREEKEPVCTYLGDSLPSIVLTYGSSISVQNAHSRERRGRARWGEGADVLLRTREREENDSHSAFII